MKTFFAPWAAAALVFLSIGGMTTTARAEAVDLEPPQAPAPGQALVSRPAWEAGLGVGGLRLPHYRGSDQSRRPA